MAVSRRVAALSGAAGVALVAVSGAAFADEFAYSFNIVGTSDYVFRGFSQTARDPTLQGGVDFTYGIGYLGVWASGLDFGLDGNGLDIADKEVDIYGGITPTWKSPFGDVTFNFGFIYYWYPNARDSGAELDYVEGRAGYSTSLIKNLTTGTTVYYSPEYTGDTGEVWTVESTAAYALPAVGPFSPTISGLLGWNKGESGNANYVNIVGNGSDEYSYWNAGLTLAVEKLSFDFRYWDTDLDDGVNPAFCKGALFQCDETFVFTAKVALP